VITLSPAAIGFGTPLKLTGVNHARSGLPGYQVILDRRLSVVAVMAGHLVGVVIVGDFLMVDAIHTELRFGFHKIKGAKAASYRTRIANGPPKIEPSK
jgi:hypothetical protein